MWSCCSRLLIQAALAIQILSFALTLVDGLEFTLVGEYSFAEPTLAKDSLNTLGVSTTTAELTDLGLLTSAGAPLEFQMEFPNSYKFELDFASTTGIGDVARVVGTSSEALLRMSAGVDGLSDLFLPSATDGTSTAYYHAGESFSKREVNWGFEYQNHQQIVNAWRLPDLIFSIASASSPSGTVTVSLGGGGGYLRSFRLWSITPVCYPDVGYVSRSDDPFAPLTFQVDIDLARDQWTGNSCHWSFDSGVGDVEATNLYLLATTDCEVSTPDHSLSVGGASEGVIQTVFPCGGWDQTMHVYPVDTYTISVESISQGEAVFMSMIAFMLPDTQTVSPTVASMYKPVTLTVIGNMFSTTADTTCGLRGSFGQLEFPAQVLDANTLVCEIGEPLGLIEDVQVAVSSYPSTSVDTYSWGNPTVSFVDDRAPVVQSLELVEVSENNAAHRVHLDETATITWLVVESGHQLSVEQVVIDGSTLDDFASSVEIIAEELSALTDYTLWIVAEDAYGNVPLEATSVAFTTLAVPSFGVTGLSSVSLEEDGEAEVAVLEFSFTNLENPGTCVVSLSDVDAFYLQVEVASTTENDVELHFTPVDNEICSKSYSESLMVTPLCDFGGGLEEGISKRMSVTVTDNEGECTIEILETTPFRLVEGLTRGVTLFASHKPDEPVVVTATASSDVVTLDPASITIVDKGYTDSFMIHAIDNEVATGESIDVEITFTISTDGSGYANFELAPAALKVEDDDAQWKTVVHHIMTQAALPISDGVYQLKKGQWACIKSRLAVEMGQVIMTCQSDDSGAFDLGIAETELAHDEWTAIHIQSTALVSPGEHALITCNLQHYVSDGVEGPLHGRSETLEFEVQEPVATIGTLSTVGGGTEGGGVTLRVEDSDQNKNPFDVEEVVVQASIAASDQRRRLLGIQISTVVNITMYETAPNSGVFEEVVYLGDRCECEETASDLAIVETVQGDEIFFTYTDSSAGDDGEMEVVAKTFVEPLEEFVWRANITSVKALDPTNKDSAYGRGDVICITFDGTSVVPTLSTQKSIEDVLFFSHPIAASFDGYFEDRTLHIEILVPAPDAPPIDELTVSYKCTGASGVCVSPPLSGSWGSNSNPLVAIVSQEAVQIDENGGEVALQVSLQFPPKDETTVYLEKRLVHPRAGLGVDFVEVDCSPLEFVFDINTWDIPQTTTCTAVDDEYADGDVEVPFVLGSDTVDIGGFTFTVTDDDVASISIEGVVGELEDGGEFLVAGSQLKVKSESKALQPIIVALSYRSMGRMDTHFVQDTVEPSVFYADGWAYVIPDDFVNVEIILTSNDLAYQSYRRSFSTLRSFHADSNLEWFTTASGKLCEEFVPASDCVLPTWGLMRVSENTSTVSLSEASGRVLLSPSNITYSADMTIVEVEILDDDVTNPPQVAINATMDGANASSVIVGWVDDEIGDIVVSNYTGTLSEGDEVEMWLTLGARPKSLIEMSFRVNNSAIATVLTPANAIMVFNGTNWNEPQRLIVSSVPDVEDDEDSSVVVSCETLFHSEEDKVTFSALQDVRMLEFMRRNVVWPTIVSLSPRLSPLWGGGVFTLEVINCGDCIVHVGATRIPVAIWNDGDGDGDGDGDSSSLRGIFPSMESSGYVPVTVENTAGGRTEISIYYSDECWQPDTYVSADGECLMCPVGGVCHGGSRVEAAAGYWTDDAELGSVASCSLPSDRCQGGGRCGAGFSGRSCSDCADFYFSVGLACLPCEPYGVALQVLGYSLFALSIPMVLVFGPLGLLHVTALLQSQHLLATVGRILTPELSEGASLTIRVLQLSFLDADSGCLVEHRELHSGVARRFGVVVILYLIYVGCMYHHQKSRRRRLAFYPALCVILVSLPSLLYQGASMIVCQSNPAFDVDVIMMHPAEECKPFHIGFGVAVVAVSFILFGILIRHRIWSKVWAPARSKLLRKGKTWFPTLELGSTSLLSAILGTTETASPAQHALASIIVLTVLGVCAVAKPYTRNRWAHARLSLPLLLLASNAMAVNHRLDPTIASAMVILCSGLSVTLAFSHISHNLVVSHKQSLEINKLRKKGHECGKPGKADAETRAVLQEVFNAWVDWRHLQELEREMHDEDIVYDTENDASIQSIGGESSSDNEEENRPDWVADEFAHLRKIRKSLRLQVPQYFSSPTSVTTSPGANCLAGFEVTNQPLCSHSRDEANMGEDTPPRPSQSPASLDLDMGEVCKLLSDLEEEENRNSVKLEDLACGDGVWEAEKHPGTPWTYVGRPKRCYSPLKDMDFKRTNARQATPDSNRISECELPHDPRPESTDSLPKSPISPMDSRPGSGDSVRSKQSQKSIVSSSSTILSRDMKNDGSRLSPRQTMEALSRQTAPPTPMKANSPTEREFSPVAESVPPRNAPVGRGQPNAVGDGQVSPIVSPVPTRSSTRTSDRHHCPSPESLGTAGSFRTPSPALSITCEKNVCATPSPHVFEDCEDRQNESQGSSRLSGLFHMFKSKKSHGQDDPESLFPTSPVLAMTRRKSSTRIASNEKRKVRARSAIGVVSEPGQNQ